MEPKPESKEDFFERPFDEVEDGYYDKRGFYTTPNGSFWDDDKVYFNHNGLDKHGGKYDKYGIYIPGPNWNDEYNCYEEEVEKNQETDKIYGQVIDNIKDELVEDYAENQKVLKNEEEELTEEQMKEIFDDAVKGSSAPNQSEKSESEKKTPANIEIKENTHENVV